MTLPRPKTRAKVMQALVLWLSDDRAVVGLEPPLTARQVIPGPLWLQAIPYLLVALPMSWVALQITV